MKNGERYKHANGNFYILVGFCKVKDASTREWKEGVIYMNWPEIGTPSNKEIYVRTKEDFAARFTKVHSPS